jgi:uncharacterized protein YdhG (YjbR/CyaY superfamily)
LTTTKAHFKTIDEYINSLPETVKPIVQTLRETIKEEAPEAIETISYNMPTFNLNGSYLVYFAAWKNHIALYPTSPALEAALPELPGYVTGKGTIQFPLSQPLPLPLIRKIVAFRVKETQEQKENKKQKSAHTT